MSKVVDVRGGDGNFAILGKALVLPASSTDGAALPLDGSIRFNPNSEAVEVYVQGNWAPLGGGGGGAGGAHNHTAAQITDLTPLLAGKSNLVHVHPFSEVPGLQTALDGKAEVGHQHSIAQVVSLQQTLDNLQTQITARTPTGHTHTIANVTGLQTALDGKADDSHFHDPLHVQGLKVHMDMVKMDHLTVCYQGKPTGSARVAVTTAYRFQVPNNFVGSFCRPFIIPTAQTVIKIRHNNVEIGQVVLATNGAATFSTLGIGPIMNAGDTLSFHFPGVADTTLETVSFSIYGERK